MRLIDADAIQIPSTSVDMFENCRNCKLLDEDQVRELINSAPTIEPKRGEWIDGIKCSKCGQVDISRPNFCPNCGSDNREE